MIIISLEDKPTWSVASEQADYTMNSGRQKNFTETPKTIDANIDNKPVQNFKASNVCAWVKGTAKPDSVIVISAHYDHLGGMGKDTYFPGANDNASGTSLLLGLAKYYAAQPSALYHCFYLFCRRRSWFERFKIFYRKSVNTFKKYPLLTKP
ncbi:MAG: M28 family peptidase [Segetibacter sp.]